MSAITRGNLIAWHREKLLATHCAKASAGAAGTIEGFEEGL
jgi:hypothetical protein